MWYKLKTGCSDVCRYVRYYKGQIEFNKLMACIVKFRSTGFGTKIVDSIFIMIAISDTLFSFYLLLIMLNDTLSFTFNKLLPATSHAENNN